MSIVLYCADSRELKLGPNGPTDADTIVFRDGFAEIASLTPTIAEWITHPGTPHIEIIDPNEGRVAPDDPAAVTCPECGKGFATEPKLRGHLLSHRKK